MIEETGGPVQEAVLKQDHLLNDVAEAQANHTRAVEKANLARAKEEQALMELNAAQERFDAWVRYVRAQNSSARECRWNGTKQG